LTKYEGTFFSGNSFFIYHRFRPVPGIDEIAPVSVLGVRGLALLKFEDGVLDSGGSVDEPIFVIFGKKRSRHWAVRDKTLRSRPRVSVADWGDCFRRRGFLFLAFAAPNIVGLSAPFGIKGWWRFGWLRFDRRHPSGCSVIGVKNSSRHDTDEQEDYACQYPGNKRMAG
jgi:hypothetical protein